MNRPIILTITLAFLLGMIPSYAITQITIDSNKESYSAGDIVELTGKIENGVEGQPVALEVKDSSGQTILIRTVTLKEDGNYDLKFKLPSSASSGKYDIVANAQVDGETVTQTKSITQTTQKESKSGGSCIIATAAFGSELAPQVQLLREVRDNVLFSTNSGTSFMIGFNQFYYSFSPTIADWERQNPMFKEAVKTTITPMLSTLLILNYVSIDSEPEMLGYGIGIILLNLGMYFVIPAIVIIELRSRFKSAKTCNL